MWNKPDKERLDQIPKLYETEKIPFKEKQIHLHFFIGDCDWYVCEFDGNDKFFGFVILNGDLEMAEWGYFYLSDLESTRIGIGLEIDCEIKSNWTIKPAKEIDLICRAQRWEKESCKEEF